jgi:hypothetical protein
MARPSPTWARMASTWVSMTTTSSRWAGSPQSVVEEVLEHGLAVRGVDDLGVELHAVDAALAVLERGHRRAGVVER